MEIVIAPGDRFDQMAQALFDDGVVLVHEPGLVREAEEVLKSLIQPLATLSMDDPEEPKTMFPRHLSIAPQLSRQVLQFYTDIDRHPPSASVRPWLGRAYPVQKRMEVFASALLVEIGQRCGFSDALIRDLVNREEWVLNAIRYPLLAEEELPAERFPAHRDWGLLTLYPAIGGDGLEVFVGGRWQRINASSVSGSLMLVYAGTTLELLTGKRIRALSHRVMNYVSRARTALIFYADAPRAMPMSQGRTVGDYIDSMLLRIKQGVS